jgi:hypothetical protein
MHEHAYVNEWSYTHQHPWLYAYAPVYKPSRGQKTHKAIIGTAIRIFLRDK